MVALGSRLAMASREGCRPCIRATWHFFLRDTNPNLPAVCSPGAACFPNRLAPGGTLEEAVAVVVIRPGVSRLARRERVRWRRVRRDWVRWRVRWRGCGSSSDKSG